MTIEEILVKLGVLLIPVIGLYLAFKSDITKQENRLTLIEKDIEHLKEQVSNNVNRLNDHQKQYLALVQLTEKVENLSEDIKRVEKKLEKGL